MISLRTIEDIAFLVETVEVECKLAAGRDGLGQLPTDFWPSYSAFANTGGGVILLGIREKDARFELVGLANPSKLRTDIFNQLNNPQKISANLLDDDKVSAINIDGKTLLAVNVPAAGRKHRPVHLNGNPLTGTYRRSNDGDRLCDAETVKRMLAEQTQDTRDNRVLRGFSMDDLSGESIFAFRQAMRDRTPTHPFLDVDDSAFLQKIGALRRDRESGHDGLTVAGLLMFGMGEAIRDEFPNYHLDYQERTQPRAEQRWVDRVTLDGTWSGNLYDFFRRIYRKLVADLKVPFALQDGQRQDETPVHQALREALVNTLVHADYTDRASVLIVKRPDMFGFRNPGKMRIPVEQAIAGGESDGRNRTLQTMFLLIGAGEKAGSGVPKIHKGWRDQHWAPPALYDLDEPSEQTQLQLRMSDLIPAEAMERLHQLFGDRFDTLQADQRLTLATAVMEQFVTHARMLSICDMHPVDLSRMLKGLVQDGFLEQSGRTRAVTYRLSGIALPTPDLAFGPPSPVIEGSDLNSEPLLESFEPSVGGSEPSPVAYGRSVAGLAYPLIDTLEGLNPDLRQDMEQTAALVKGRSKVAANVSRDAITRLCNDRYLTIRVLSALLGRDEDYLRLKILNPLVQSKALGFVDTYLSQRMVAASVTMAR
ncbi:MAG: AAA family ATPase [Azospirillum brasilense]|nr:MAG: AAA family ATPase [Azospirillum brasilense]